jgi:hypothetical protein
MIAQLSQNSISVTQAWLDRIAEEHGCPTTFIAAGI